MQLETEKEEESADDQKKRLQQKVALNLDSMLKYGGTSQKQKEKESKDAESGILAREQYRTCDY